MKQSSIEWLAEKYNYVFWLRNRDEISPQQGDEYRSKYLQIAREMHKDEIMDAHIEGQREFDNYPHTQWTTDQAEDYYNRVFTK